ncbi:MAG TPA: hypothetical protein VFU93_00395 [Acidimicrobiales bacterium]|nr:hypothetical protein [Acidimicrobiales bacterium]
MSSYYLVAVLLVLAIPIAAMGALVGLAAWTRDALTRAPVVGALGALCTFAAITHLVLPRACGDGTNRPIVAAAVGLDECRRIGVASVALVVLLLAATATVTRLGDVRR